MEGPLACADLRAEPGSPVPCAPPWGETPFLWESPFPTNENILGIRLGAGFEPDE